MSNDRWNYAHYGGQRRGHYESYFVRANHPEKSQAFWIRYTIFSPKSAPERALGELWAMFFNGENGTHVVAKREVPFSACRFDQNAFHVRVDDSTLENGNLRGQVASNGNSFTWDLTYLNANSAPLLLFPEKLYRTTLPAAKSLVPAPLAKFSGRLEVNGEPISVDGWTGSQNHNWGFKHTDEYAWGQVAGFDSHPESFLEIATARLKIGPFWTPPITPIVLRHRGTEYRLNTISQSFANVGRYTLFDWHFSGKQKDAQIAHIEGRIWAQPEAFVGLRYYNPPGGVKSCLNTKIAACELKLNGAELLVARNRAAFEILTSRTDHGIALRA